MALSRRVQIHKTFLRAVYLNPLNLFKIPGYLYHVVSSIFSGSPSAPQRLMTDRDVVVLNGLDKEGFVWLKGIKDYWYRICGDFSIVEVTLSNQTKIGVAKTFLSDIERIGQPDEFYIDGEKITEAPRTDDQKVVLLEKLLQIANGDREVVKDWTTVWNYCPKVVIMNEVHAEFLGKYKLNPVVGNGFDTAQIRLDTQKALLTCHVSGKISFGTAEEGLDTFPVKVRYVADMTFNAQKGIIQNSIAFSDCD